MPPEHEAAPSRPRPSVAGAGQKAGKQPQQRRGAERRQLTWRAAVWLHLAAVYASAAYVLYVLASVVAWVSHLGARVSLVGAVAAGGANPMRRAAAGLAEVAVANAPPALAFVLSHSLLRPVQLKRLGLGQHAQLVYCVISAVTLHWFIAGFVPHDSPVVMVLPLPALAHACLSLGSLLVAFGALLAERKTYVLLGVPQALAALEGSSVGRDDERPEAGMDIITWQGLLMYRLGGAAAFVAFSGLSILPAEVTASDLVVRVVAALYLRQRSRGFRGWVDKIENVHLFTWVLRLGLVLAALKHSSAELQAGMLAAGLLAVVALRAAETNNSKLTIIA